MVDVEEVNVDVVTDVLVEEEGVDGCACTSRLPPYMCEFPAAHAVFDTLPGPLVQ